MLGACERMLEEDDFLKKVAPGFLLIDPLDAESEQSRRVVRVAQMSGPASPCAGRPCHSCLGAGLPNAKLAETSTPATLLFFDGWAAAALPWRAARGLVNIVPTLLSLPCPAAVPSYAVDFTVSTEHAIFTVHY